MSNPLAILSGAAQALSAHQTGLAVAGQNIANANTPGYRHRVAEFVSVAAASGNEAGRGVRVSGIRADRDVLLDQRLYRERPWLGRESAIADSLSTVEATLGEPGHSIDADLARFFDAFARLAEDPTGSTARQSVLTEGRQLAGAFRDMADRLAGSRRNADAEVRHDVTEVNRLAARIASLNKQLGSSGGDDLQLRDEQAEAIRELSELIDIDVLEPEYGGVDISFGSGRPLVVSGNSYEITATAAPPNGHVSLSSKGTTVTSEITGGRLGGHLQVRDTLVPAYEARLDELAFTVATQVNTLHDAGFDLNGADAGVFFTALGSQTGAAAAITVDPTLAANANLLAAAGTADAGDNQTATAIAELRDARVLGGNLATVSDAWAELVSAVGSDVRSAEQERATREGVIAQVESLQDAVSGVSLDEEAVMLLRFQRAYEATARFYQVVDSTLDVLIQSMGR